MYTKSIEDVLWLFDKQTARGVGVEKHLSSLSRELFVLTVDWGIRDWKVFRVYCDYYHMKKQADISNTSYYSYGALKFKTWKVKKIKEFNKLNKC